FYRNGRSATEMRRLESAGAGSSACERRVGREIAADAVAHRLGELLLVPVALELQFFFGVRDERGLDQDRWNVRRLEHRKAGLLDGGLVQRVDRTDAIEHMPADLEAVAD